MYDEAHMLIIKKKRRFCIPKNLNISHCWNTIGPTVAQEIGASDYTPIPNYFDTNAYKIGHIFVSTSTQVKCFRPASVLKILGPIHNFVVKSKTNTKWLDKKLHSVRTSGDQTNFRSGKNQLSFTGHDYFFLSKAHDMLTEGNVTIDRTAHEDLLNVTWIGLITHVVVTRISEFRIIKDLQSGMRPFIFPFWRKRVAHVRAPLNCRQAGEKPGKRSRRRSTFVLEMSEWTGDVSTTRANTRARTRKRVSAVSTAEPQNVRCPETIVAMVKEDTSSSRSWGSVGHVSTLEGVHESGDGVHSQDRDRQVTRAGHARPLRRAGVCTCTEGQFENKQLENGQTLAGHLRIDVAFFCALYSCVMYRRPTL
ncbi:hypothetical protein ALC62_02666 [Cyphomyrmex costatus]|uniref:Uncharacterized protein n=1 Tax=Cyphomyrmex costatus TaxID=456900 RepID=A0A195D1Q0_9HYME|nr:hypothetical protein ALC62_02666 [Cyphomyrmex costatus]